MHDSRTISFRAYRDPDPHTVAEYNTYEPTLEDLLHIQEYFLECELVAQQVEIERRIDETATVAERTDHESPLVGAIVRLCEELHDAAAP